MCFPEIDILLNHYLKPGDSIVGDDLRRLDYLYCDGVIFGSVELELDRNRDAEIITIYQVIIFTQYPKTIGRNGLY